MEKETTCLIDETGLTNNDNTVYYDTKKQQFYIIRWEYIEDKFSSLISKNPVRYYIPK